MTDAAAAPRLDVLLGRIDSWADRGAGRALLVKVGATVAGPLVMIAGVAMLVLPGPGLVAIAAGLGLLAQEYSWARRAVAALGRSASRVRQAIPPKESSPGRRAVGAVVTIGILAAGFAATAACTAFLGAHSVL